MPDFNFIKGKINKRTGAANKTLPAIISKIPNKSEKIIIKNLTFFEIFLVLALANHTNIRLKIIKIIIPKKTKFIYYFFSK